MTADIRVGFLGGVRHAADYAQLLRSLPATTVVGVADEKSAPEWIRRAGSELADGLGVEWMTDIDALLGDRVDLVVVCSEPTRHARLAVAALSTGADVCIDKPVATSLPDAEQVAVTAERSPGLCAVVNRTFSPALRRLRSAIDGGSLGLPRHVDVEFLASSNSFAADVENPLLVVDPALSGGGELRNFLGYAVDAIRYLTGLEIEQVYAESSTLFDGMHAKHSVEDAGVVSLLLENGATATATVGRVPAVPTIGAAHCTFRVIGSHGDAVASDERPRILRLNAAQTSAVPVGGSGGIQALTGFFADLLEGIRDRRPPAYSPRDAVANVAVVDAAYRSIAEGRDVAMHPRADRDPATVVPPPRDATQ